MEGREKLYTIISDGLKVLQDGRAGGVPRVKNLTRKLNFAALKFSGFDRNRENLLTAKTSRRTVFAIPMSSARLSYKSTELSCYVILQSLSITTNLC